MQSSSDIHFENCYNVGTIACNKLDESTGYPTSSATVSPMAAVTQYGTEFIRNCYSNVTSISGAAWKNSSALGRKVLVSIPEDTHLGNVYSVDPGKVGTFTDVKADVWYADAVKWALDKGIVSGARFSPKNTCTRAQLITFLWIAAVSPKMSGANPFTDVKTTDSYYDAALWAREKGLVGGTVFAPTTTLTRGEFVVSLWKSLGCPEGLQANQYLDIESHQSDFGRAVAWSHVRGVMGATAKNKFSPKKSCTRAEVINIMYRALK